METLKDEGSVEEGRPTGRLAWVVILLITLAGILLIAADWRNFAAVLAQADWRPLLWVLLLTVISYVCVSSAFAAVGRLLGIPMSFRLMAETGFVSIILNHVLTTGGVAGYSVRYILMQRHGAAARDILAASILHADLPAGITVLVGVMTLLMAAVAGIATGLIFVEELRLKVTRSLIHAARALLHRDPGEMFQRFHTTLSRGVAAMHAQPSTVLQVMALTWIDWFASVGVVWLCFDALGEPVRLGVILTGYVIGVMAGVLSMMPGGFGIQEGSMAGVFVLLGAPFQQALLASILFRGIFFLLPYGASLAFYGRLLRTTGTKP